MNCLALIIALFTLVFPIAPNRTPDQTFEASLLHDGQTGPATIHGREKEVKVVGLSRDGQQRNLADLHRPVRIARELGIRVTFGSWCNYYHTAAAMTPVDPSSRAAPDTVSGRTEANLVPYVIAAISRFLEEFPEIFNVHILMMDVSGSKTYDTKQFWRGIFTALKIVVPDIQYEFRAKRVSDDLIRQVLDLGLRIWVNIKFWIEQVGLPIFHTHVDLPDQPTRPGIYAATIADLKILSDLAAYHLHRSAAGMSYALFEKIHDLNALDGVIRGKSYATDAWARIVRDPCHVNNSDMMMGLPPSGPTRPVAGRIREAQGWTCGSRETAGAIPPGGSPRSRTIRFGQRADPARLSTKLHQLRGLAVIWSRWMSWKAVMKSTSGS